MHLQPGQVLADKYRIVRMIGQGGMGAVYEGENVRIRRRVAIKTLHAQVSQKADVLERFEREAQAAGRIGSEHIVEVLDMGDLPDGARFMVMEFLDGMTLGDRIVRQGRVPPRELVPIIGSMLDGLAAAHAAGIIHRDLKPANVFLVRSRTQNDFVKILDFGVSKFNVLANEEMSMTRTGAVVGTPYYMSPEQAKGSRGIDARSDLYSAGVILYEAVTGQVPFNAETFNELIFKIALESPPPPEQFVPNLDPSFAGIMRRAMAREPAERFQTALEMRDALYAWASGYDAYGGSPQAGHRGSAPHLDPSMRTQMLPHVGGAQPERPVKTAIMQAVAHARASHAAPIPTQVMPGPPPGAHAGPAAHVSPSAPMFPAPLPAPAQPFHEAAPTPPRNHAPLFVGLSVALLCLAGGGYFVYAKTLASRPTEEAPSTATAATTPSPDPAPADTATAASAEPAADPDAEPSAAAAVSSDAPPAPSAEPVAGSPTTARPPPPGTARPPGTTRPTGTTAATATKPPTTTSSSGGRSIGSDL